MKETIKAGIGGYAFTFDIDAYEMLNKYLENLKDYFQNKEDGQEIIADIEGRMSELLLLKATSPDHIITLSDAHYIIEIMGNPIDFADGDDIQTQSKQTSDKKKENPQFEKKLYRDTDHSVIGGVCSGIGQYFRIDPVIIRAAYIFSIFVANKISDRLSMLLFVSYFILWVVMPKAKTIVQKISMTGQNPSIEGIETGTMKYQEMRGGGLSRTIGKILKVFLSIVLYFTGISILLSAFFSLLFPSIMDLPSIKDFMEVSGLYSWNNIIATSIAWLVPAFIILYLAARLMTKFTSRNLVVLGVAFLIWLSACSYLAIKGVRFAKDYRNEITLNEKFTLAIQPDTLHVQLDEYYRHAETAFDNSELYMIDDSPRSWFIAPYIEVKKDSIYKNIEVEVKKTVFGRSWQIAQDKAQNARLELVEQSSTLTIKPHTYNKENHWDREIFAITIYCPADKTILVNDPLERKTFWHKQWRSKRKMFNNIF